MTVADIPEALAQRRERFLAFLERRLGDRQLAEDLLQDAFVRSIDKGETVRDPEAAVAWFYRVLRNAAIDHHRRGARGAKALEALADELEASDVFVDDRGAVCACVGQLAETLKPEYAAALRRIEIDGLPVKDYALEVGITPNNAAVRVFRAREALRRQVQRVCGTCATRGCTDCTCT